MIDSPLMTVAEVIACLRISRVTLRRLMRDGRIRGFKLGSQWRFHATDIRRIIETVEA